MSYVISVGGDPINPNPFTYSQIAMTGNIVLVWPANTQDATYTATNWIDITASAAYAATMPPATEVGNGEEVVFYNYGSYTITINDSTGGNITTVASGLTKRIWVTDNTTDAGTWRIANIGSGTTSADASMLAGYGLTPLAGQLSQSMPPLSYSTNATINAGNRAALSDWIGGVGTFTLTSPATLGSNWFTNVKNSGTGILTLDGNGATIDGSSTLQVDIQQGFTLATDGVSFYTVGRPIVTTPAITQLSKSVAGSADVTLTAAEAAYSIINFTGALTGNINVIVPSNVNEWLMYNNTTGAYTLTVKTAAGSGVAITQGTRRLLYCDGTNVQFQDSVGTGTVTSIATGTGLSGGPITNSGTISLANTAVVAGGYTLLNATVDAQGRLTAASTTTDLTTTVTIGGAYIYRVGGTDVAVTDGGTGLSTLTANNVILGNGTSAPQFVAPGTSGNVLTSNGTTWTSSAGSSIIKTITVQTFTSSVTYTPTTGMVYCEIEGWGGGGGGGGVSSQNNVAGGGGAGGYVKKTVSAATIGGSQSVTIGTGGTAGNTSGSDGGTGGTTSVGSIVSATGGVGGSGQSGGSVLGGAGGTGSSGDINATGAPGGFGVPLTASIALSGIGGSTSLGGGGASTNGGTGNNGVASSGAGGSGGASVSGGGSHAGGFGATGFVIITEYCNQ